MRVLSETVSPFAENTYFLVEAASAATVVVDPGDEAERLLGVVREHELKVEKILLTHAHLDHVGAAAEMQRVTGAPVAMHAADQFLLEGLSAQAELFGLRPCEPPEIDVFLKEGDVVDFGSAAIAIRVLETPGHSPGSVSFALEGILLSGDVLFAGSIGRTDLPGADHATLLRTIRDRVLSFPDATQVYPGHGPATTVGRERRNNPFLAELAP